MHSEPRRAAGVIDDVCRIPILGKVATFSALCETLVKLCGQDKGLFALYARLRKVCRRIVAVVAFLVGEKHINGVERSVRQLRVFPSRRKRKVVHTT